MTKRILLSIENRLRVLLRRLFCCLAASFGSQLHATDYVVTHAPNDDKDIRQKYVYELLEQTLKITQNNFGDYHIDRSVTEMPRNRLFMELDKGELLNVMVSPPIREQNTGAIRVPFPLQKGIASYRIFFVTQQNKNIFRNIDTLTQLKQIPTGFHHQWSTTKIFQHHNFNVVQGFSYKGLFEMLSKGRFHSFGRGITEIALELRVFKPQFPNLTFDEHIAVFTYLPSYFYVSPKAPRIAKRIGAGLIKLNENGYLDQMLYRYYGNDIDKLNLSKRRVFTLSNINISEEMYQQDKPFLWDLSKDSRHLNKN